MIEPEQLDPKAAESVSEQLIASGIGTHYADMRLSKFRHADKSKPTGFLDLFSSDKSVRKKVNASMRKGMRWYVYGTYARQFGCVFAGAVMRNLRFPVMVLHLSDLSDALDNSDAERLEEVMSRSLIVVHSFVNASSPPLTPRSAFRVERFLYEALESRKSIMLTGELPIAQAKGQWNDALTQHIRLTFSEDQISNYVA